MEGERRIEWKEGRSDEWKVEGGLNGRKEEK